MARELQTTMTSPLAPDFYDYAWDPIARAAVDGEFVAVSWADGLSYRAHAWWLRETVVGDGATDPVTREGTVDPASLPPDLVANEAVIVGGALHLTWSDGFVGTVHPGWLRHVAEQRHGADAWLPEPEHWTRADMNRPPTFSGPSALGEDDTLRRWIASLVRFGVARLEGLDTLASTVLDVTGRIGPPRETNFGRDWDVKAEILRNDQNSTANTTLRLGPHTDLPTREVPPGFQFLHCIANAAQGGCSTMTDGAAIADHLASAEPETFDALTNLRWIFFNRSREHDHRWSGPMLDCGTEGSPLTIRAFYPVRAFPDMAERDIPRAYRAARRFHELAADPRFQIRYALRPGDLVGFDNRRMLHGRDAFDHGAGERHLRGCYIDHDEVYSRLRVLERRHERVVGSGSATLSSGRRL